MESIIPMVEHKMDQTTNELSIKKKVFNIMVECMQNICQHADHVETNKGSKTSITTFTYEDDQIIVTSGNLIKNDRVEGLKNIIDNVNNMNDQDLDL